MATISRKYNTGTNNGIEQSYQKIKGTSTWNAFGTTETTTAVSFLSGYKTFTANDNTVYDLYVLGANGCSSPLTEVLEFVCPTISVTTGVSSASISIPTNATLGSVDFVLSGTSSATNNVNVVGSTTSTTFVGLVPGSYTVQAIMYTTLNGNPVDSSSLNCTTTFTIAVPACTAPSALTIL